MFILNESFRRGGTTNQALMSKKGNSDNEIEQVVANTCSRFASELGLSRGSEIDWDELDPRKVLGRDHQLQRM